MKKTIFAFIFIFAAAVSAAFADDRNMFATEQAKQDYKVFLEQLKAMNAQYKQITGEIKGVLEEQGVPTFDENTGEISMQKPDFSGKKVTTPGTFGDVDVRETDKEIFVKVDLPGVKKEAIKVSIQDNKLLHIEGERKEESEVKKESADTRYYRFERQRGQFARTIELPALVKDSGTEARYENGVLTVRIPKAPTPKKEVPVAVR